MVGTIDLVVALLSLGYSLAPTVIWSDDRTIFSYHSDNWTNLTALDENWHLTVEALDSILSLYIPRSVARSIVSKPEVNVNLSLILITSYVNSNRGRYPLRDATVFWLFHFWIGWRKRKRYSDSIEASDGLWVSVHTKQSWSLPWVPSWSDLFLRNQ